MAKNSKTLKSKRSPNKPIPVTPERKIVSRIEASRMLGVSVDTIKRRLERRRGGTLDPIKLGNANSTTFYRLEQIEALIEIPASEAA